MKPPVIVITGPTACGKSELAVEIAGHCADVEIVSADSAQVYRGMDIGTAKPDKSIRELIPHHLVDIRDPGEPYSASDFCADAAAVIEDIYARGKVPLLTGGTMLYLKTLRDGLASLPAADPAVRARIVAFADAEGWPAVHARLALVDPESSARINPNDPQRLQRALEVFELTGKTMTELHAESVAGTPFEFIRIAILPPDRAALHQKIAQRFEQMLSLGFVDEVRVLYERGDLNAELPSIKAVGYRQVWSYLAGEMSFDDMQEKAIIATRQLAKRQHTWLRGWPDLRIVESADVREVLKILDAASILRIS